MSGEHMPTVGYSWAQRGKAIEAENRRLKAEIYALRKLALHVVDDFDLMGYSPGAFYDSLDMLRKRLAEWPVPPEATE